MEIITLGVTNKIPDVIEITYVRKDIIGNVFEYNKINLPIQNLDFPNHPQLPDIDLNFYPFII
jgi:hypothetical protein